MTLEQMLRAKRTNQAAIDKIVNATANRMPTLKECAAIEHHQLSIAKLNLLIARVTDHA